MKSVDNFRLSESNAAVLERYADLVELSPETFLNRFIAEFLVNRFADPQSGNAEPFLLSFSLKVAATAQRLADWVKERLTVPSSRDRVEVEVFELPEDSFGVKAAWIGHSLRSSERMRRQNSVSPR
jgi:hypothetical protein